jgi:hypothetical protein
MLSLPKRIAGVRVPRTLRKKRGLAKFGAILTAMVHVVRKKASSFAR